MNDIADRKLLENIYLNNLEGVRMALKDGANPSVIGIMNASALMYAINNKSAEMVQALLEAGADVNYVLTVDMGFGIPVKSTALKRAKGDGATEIVKLLEAAGAKE